MKLLTFVITIAAASAATVDNKYDLHYTQHQSSVDNARMGLQERLSKLETGYQRAYSSGGSENYVAGCSSCVGGSSSALNSRSASSSSASQSSGRAGMNSDYVGVGVVGHSNTDEENDVQTRLSNRYSSNAYDADELQVRQVPADLHNIHSSAYRSSASRNEHEEEEDEDDVQRTVGVGYHDGAVNSDRYSYAQRRQQQQLSESESRTERTRTVPVYYVPAASSSTSSLHRSSAASGSESQIQENRNIRPVPVGNYVSMAVRPGTATVLQIPVRGNYDVRPITSDQAASSRSDYQSGSELSQTRVQPVYRTVYYPASTYSSSADRSSAGSRIEESRTTVTQQPEKYVNSDLTNYNSFNRNLDSRYNSDDSQVQERVSPITDSSSSSSSRLGSASSSNYGSVNARVVPAFPVNTIESASLQRTAEEREQRRFSAGRPAFVSTHRASNVENDDSRSQVSTVNRPSTYSTRTSVGGESSGSQYGSSGSNYYVAPVPISTLSSRNQAQSQHQANSGSQLQYQSGVGAGGVGYMRTGYGGYVRPGAVGSVNTISGSQASTAGSASSLSQSRFGSDVRQTGSEDLLTYMSESERLAREQQRQIAGSASQVATVDEANRRALNSAANLDSAAASFVSSSNLSNRLASELDNVENVAGTGGYQRVKSWQKQSKWASGSEYDSDGKIKSHSMLSTAEAEKHNIDGKTAGFQAATTTLENDGKVSTYSIHTP